MKFEHTISRDCPHCVVHSGFIYDGDGFAIDCPDCHGEGLVELRLTVEGEYEAPSRGARDSLGVPEEPDDPGGFEIDTITDQYCQSPDLTDDEMDEIYQSAEMFARDLAYER